MTDGKSHDPNALEVQVNRMKRDIKGKPSVDSDWLFLCITFRAL